MLAYEMLTSLPPWFDSDRQELYRKRISSSLSFPSRSRVSRSAKSFISGLLDRNPATRLGSPREGDCGGAASVLGHPFFGAGMRGVPRIVSNLLNRRISSPLAIYIRGAGDTRNADPALRSRPVNFSAGTLNKEAAKLRAKGQGSASKRPWQSFGDFGPRLREDDDEDDKGGDSSSTRHGGPTDPDASSA
jgi:serum/glucocorticoid-regulated kinase 2